MLLQKKTQSLSVLIHQPSPKLIFSYKRSIGKNDKDRKKCKSAVTFETKVLAQ